MTGTPAAALPAIVGTAEWDIFTRPLDSPDTTPARWCRLLDAAYCVDVYGEPHIITQIRWQSRPCPGMTWHPTYNTPQIRRHTGPAFTLDGDQYQLFDTETL